MSRHAIISAGPGVISRRRFLQSGAVTIPWLNCAGLLASRGSRAAASDSPAPAGRIKSCIVVFFYGGQSHLDTWDPKPDAPAETRGEFRPAATRVPGLFFSEHLPHSARVADKLAIVRSMHHGLRIHNAAAAETLTGRTPLKGDEPLLADDANSFPCYGSAVSKLAPRRAGLPTHVALPHVMHNVVVLPGQAAGFLGPAFNPFQITRDPSEADFRVDDLHLPADVGLSRLAARQSLLARIQSHVPNDAGMAAMSGYRDDAYALLQSQAFRRGLAIEQESDKVRERFGRNKLGQSLLLARRLVEAGVRFINVNDKVRNSQLTNWDSHQDNAGRLKNDLLPPADRGLAALVEDLDERGLLESTLVVALGEFGRTPAHNKQGGRDHWPDCFSVVLAGGGVQGGAIYGASDRLGAYPHSDPVTPGDLAATMFWRLGLDPETELHDLVGRPQKLATGKPLAALFGA